MEAAIERGSNIGADQDIDPMFARKVFDSCRRIDDISDDCVLEILRGADHACNDRPLVDPDPNVERRQALTRQLLGYIF